MFRILQVCAVLIAMGSGQAWSQASTEANPDEPPQDPRAYGPVAGMSPDEDFLHWCTAVIEILVHNGTLTQKNTGIDPYAFLQKYYLRIGYGNAYSDSDKALENLTAYRNAYLLEATIFSSSKDPKVLRFKLGDCRSLVN